MLACWGRSSSPPAHWYGLCGYFDGYSWSTQLAVFGLFVHCPRASRAKGGLTRFGYFELIIGHSAARVSGVHPLAFVVSIRSMYVSNLWLQCHVSYCAWTVRSWPYVKGWLYAKPHGLSSNIYLPPRWFIWYSKTFADKEIFGNLHKEISGNLHKEISEGDSSSKDDRFSLLCKDMDIWSQSLWALSLDIPCLLWWPLTSLTVQGLNWLNWLTVCFL